MEEVRSIPIALIESSPFQPRLRFKEEALEELAASIRQHGIIQPVVLRPLGARYELVAGERRVRAARKLGILEVPAIVRPYTDDQALETALIENLQREDVSVVEAAQAYERLTREFHYSQSQIAQRTGKSRAAIANTLRLLQLPREVLEPLDAGDLSEGHARALLAVPYPSVQVELAEWIVRNAVTVRETERKVRTLNTNADVSPAELPGGVRRDVRPNAYIAALEDRLRRHFGSKVSITYRKGRGALTVEFYSDDDLARVIELVGADAE